MKDKVEDLREHLFETIERLKSGEMKIETAQAISSAAQVVINSAKVEVDFLKATGRMTGTGFIDTQSRTDLPPPRIPASTHQP